MLEWMAPHRSQSVRLQQARSINTAVMRPGRPPVELASPKIAGRMIPARRRSRVIKGLRESVALMSYSKARMI